MASASDLEKLVARLENVTVRLESASSRGGGGGGGGGACDDSPIWMDDYSTFHKDVMEKFATSTIALGSDMAEMGKLVEKAFTAHRNFLLLASQYNRPKDADLQGLLKSLSEGITNVQTFRESKRRSAQFNHMSAVSEAIPFLGWVAVAPKPAAHIKQMEESGQFYTNKVLKEFRESDPKQADWATSLIKLLKGLESYVKDNHGTGVSWNKEKPAATCSSTVAGGAPSGAGAPPPLPPGPAPPPPPPVQAGGASSGGGDPKAELFAQLNKGSGVTQGLKKVTADMQTHKNPKLKAQGPVAAAKSSALSPRPYSPPTFKKFNAPAADKPPVFELKQKKWIVEWQKNNQTLVIDETNDKQTVYMYKCSNSVLQVKGKINSITLDSCTKCGIVFEDLISTCEFVNCQSVKAQANGKVPTISIDKTDGAQIYLNEKSLDTQVISAKSSEMNVCITKDNGDFTEFPVPEQYKTVYDGKKLITSVMEI